MNILILIDNFLSPNGAEQSIIKIINNLSTKQNFYLAALEYKSELVKCTKAKDFLPLVPYSLFSKNLFRNLSILSKFVKDKNIQLIMSFYEGSDFLTFCLKKIFFKKLKIISNRRDLGYRLKKQHHIMYFFISSFFDRIVCASNSIKFVNIKRYKIPNSKIEVIYNGIDLEKFDRIFENSKREFKDTLNISTCTSFRKVKRIDLMLTALSILHKKYKNFLFHLVGGEDEIKKEELINLAQNLKIKDKLFFWGWQTNIPAILKNFDIYINASDSEGLSNAILEAMAAYMPVVATNVGGNKELVFHNQNGFLFPVGNSEKMAEYLEILVKDSALRKKMGYQSRKIVEDKFTQKRMLSNYQKLFESVL